MPTDKSSSGFSSSIVSFKRTDGSSIPGLPDKKKSKDDNPKKRKKEEKSSEQEKSQFMDDGAGRRKLQEYLDLLANLNSINIKGL